MDRKILGIALSQVGKKVTEEVNSKLPEEVAEYCQENFSEWQGGLDQGLTNPTMAAPANLVGNLKSALSDNSCDIYNYSVALINDGNVVIDNRYTFEQGNIANATGNPSSSNTRCRTTKILVPKGANVKVTANTGYDVNNTYWYGLDGTYISYGAKPSNAVFAIVTVRKSDGTADINPTEATNNFSISITVDNSIESILPTIEKADKLLDFVGTSGNYADTKDEEIGLIKNEGTLNTGDAYTGFRTTRFIEIKSNTTYSYRVFNSDTHAVILDRKALLLFDENKTPITASYVNNNTDISISVSSGTAKYVRLTHRDAFIPQFEEGSGHATYVPYSQVFNGELGTDALNFTARNISKLSNKKYVACGDSFTQGAFDPEMPVEDYKFQDFPYKGENKVYPFYIGRRTGAVIVNEAKSGSTMAYIDGTKNEFSTPNGRYTQIPADADYITLYFGINDSHQSVPIGTIDDNVNTTFYGAWNIVMTYLITNHPNAKIGIIISNGCDSIDYPNAEIAIAKKYGIAYFDMNGDYKIPLVFRVNGKPDISDAVKNLRTLQYRVSATNLHPNAACHEDESTFIQSWLESI